MIWKQSSPSMWCKWSLTHYHSLPGFLTLIVKRYRSRKSKRACQGAKVETGAVYSRCKIRLRRSNLYASALVWICRSSISAHSHVASLGGLFGVGGRWGGVQTQVVVPLWQMATSEPCWLNSSEFCPGCSSCSRDCEYQYHLGLTVSQSDPRIIHTMEGPMYVVT